MACEGDNNTKNPPKRKEKTKQWGKEAEECNINVQSS